MVNEFPGAYYSYYYLKAWSWSTDILEVFGGDWSCWYLLIQGCRRFSGVQRRSRVDLKPIMNRAS